MDARLAMDQKGAVTRQLQGRHANPALESDQPIARGAEGIAGSEVSRRCDWSRVEPKILLPNGRPRQFRAYFIAMANISLEIYV